MSPEQAKGKRVDRRTDVWAFGAVLYEMLTRRRAFQGDLVAEILASVIRDEPDYAALPADLHRRVLELVERCLEKEPRNRWQAAGDIRVELARAMTHPDETDAVVTAASSRVKLRLVLPWVVASVLVAGAGGWFLKPSEPLPVMRFRHELREGQQFTNVGRSLVDVARDGSQFVYVANTRLHLRPIDGIDAIPVPLTEGGVTGPVFSPDGRWIAYWSQQDTQLKKVATSGGAPMTIAAATNPFGMSWRDDDTIVFGQPEGILRVSANGGAPEMLIQAEEDEQIDGPQILPGGDAVLFTTTRASGTRRWDEAEIVVQSLESGERKVLLTGAGDARYLPTGHLVYAVADTLMSSRFDLQTLDVTGAAVSVNEGVQRAARTLNATASANYAISASGTLVYVAASDMSSDQRSLALVNRDESDDVTRLDVPPAPYMSPRISPDGRKLAVQTLGEEGRGVVWIYDLAGDEAIRQLTLEGDNRRPIWTPDSRYVTFSSDRDGTMSLYMQLADGSGIAERLTTAEEGTAHEAGSWSPDGRTLSFMVVRGADRDLWTVVRGAGNVPERIDVPGWSHGPEFSPDGTLLAFGAGDDDADQDVYVERFPPTGTRQRISQSGGNHPLWAPDGGALFYRRSAGLGFRSLQFVNIATGPDFAFGNERTLPLGRFLVFSTYRDYDVTPDGRWFVLIVPSASGEKIDIVLNWLRELQRLVPNND